MSVVSGDLLERQVKLLDARLNALERDALTRLDGSLKQSAANLEREVQRLYKRAQEQLAQGQSAGAAIAEARARILLQQVRGLLTITSGAPADDTFTQLIRGTHAAGIDGALSMLSPYERELASMAGVTPVSAAAMATRVSGRLIDIGNARVANAKARLAQHGQDAARAIERHVTDGLVRGTGWRKTARAIRQEVDITRYGAERIVRTESVAASDAARREAYSEAGVDAVQVIVTMDSLLCGYCANRAGRVYKRGDIQLPFHPFCRCTTAPWRQEWQDLGLTDDAWAERHRRVSLERAAEPQKTGPSPSEVWRGLDSAPQPIWAPRL